MKVKYLDEQNFYDTFLPLIAELACGKHYDPSKKQHVDWLRQTLHVWYLSGGNAICLFGEDDEPMGHVLVLFDKGLEDVCCFGKKATILLFGLFPQYRSQGLGAMLMKEAEDFARRNGAECLYVDTYAGNSGAIRFYAKSGFIPVAYHPGECGLKDKGQVYLYKELILP